jgi:hypothetical protein
VQILDRQRVEVVFVDRPAAGTFDQVGQDDAVSVRIDRGGPGMYGNERDSDPEARTTAPAMNIELEGVAGWRPFRQSVQKTVTGRMSSHVCSVSRPHAGPQGSFEVRAPNT